MGDGLTGDAAVASDDHASFVAVLRERGGVSDDHFGRERRSDDSSDTGNTNHEGHRKSFENGGRMYEMTEGEATLNVRVAFRTFVEVF